MRALLDTNIIIHRENTQVTNYSIGLLFYWLDKLHYEKCIHPLTVQELRKLSNITIQQLYDAKLSAYTILKTTSQMTPEFQSMIASSTTTPNDEVDNQLLFEVYSGRLDMLITEDRRLKNKASLVGVESRVYTINSFITKETAENPELINYKMLSVRKIFFGSIDVQNRFFDSFRSSYAGFNKWFLSKSDEEAYICRNDGGDILGFLYLKTEFENENYADISPKFAPKKRLKVGTFKVETTGFRLGERFVKIIFDNAIERKLDEIYLTMFENSSELTALENLLIKWGFEIFGKKSTNGFEETVLVKRIGGYDNHRTPKENFPNLSTQTQKFILPIMPKYHTTLLPDSKLNTENEVDFLGQFPHRYALQKVYITWSGARDVATGDIIIFYRPGEIDGRKKFESVLTTIGVIEEIRGNFPNKEEYLKCCQNRSVFSNEELDYFWRTKRYSLQVVKFIYVKSLRKRLNLAYLWDKEIVEAPNGPRPFTRISDSDYEMILRDSETR